MADSDSFKFSDSFVGPGDSDSGSGSGFDFDLDGIGESSAPEQVSDIGENVADGEDVAENLGGIDGDEIAVGSGVDFTADSGSEIDFGSDSGVGIDLEKSSANEGDSDPEIAANSGVGIDLTKPKAADSDADFATEGLDEATEDSSEEAIGVGALAGGTSTEEDEDEEDAKKKSGMIADFDAYNGLLLASMLFIGIATFFLIWEVSDYGGIFGSPWRTGSVGR